MPQRDPVNNSGLMGLAAPAQTSGKHRFRELIDFSKFTRRKRSENGEPSSVQPEQSNHDGDQYPNLSLQPALPKAVRPLPPRPLTFQRQISERRERLLPHTVCGTERRAAMTSSKRARSAIRNVRSKSPPPPFTRQSAPEIRYTFESMDEKSLKSNGHTLGLCENGTSELGKAHDQAITSTQDESAVAPPHVLHDSSRSDDGSSFDDLDDPVFLKELSSTWMLNMIMHFRDRSEREKFIITYAETPNSWRRVTVTCDYRDAEVGSLEESLKTLRYQHDKNARIYHSIKDSLSEIAFYDTVTNLKLRTEEQRLHVHVTEDVNEIVDYPQLTDINHLRLSTHEVITEDMISYVSHQTGFVYQVKVEEEVFIKKEIPSPDTVQEFLYEINALHALRNASSVIGFRGVVVDRQKTVIKGLLIDFASHGALVDILSRDTPRETWEQRERWARQITQGLFEIHNHGFVQGDFTLSNIVVDIDGNAKIIDMNRRGCPVGWEPPEFEGLISSSQKVGIYIGVKSDLYQLGMVLWALAMNCDEPERQDDLLFFDDHDPANAIPSYFRDIIRSCLSYHPSERESAETLLAKFPDSSNDVLHEASQPTMLVTNGYADIPQAKHTTQHPSHFPLTTLAMDNEYSALPRDSRPIDSATLEQLPSHGLVSNELDDLKIENQGEDLHTDATLRSLHTGYPQSIAFEDIGVSLPHEYPNIDTAITTTASMETANQDHRVERHKHGLEFSDHAPISPPLHQDSGFHDWAYLSDIEVAQSHESAYLRGESSETMPPTLESSNRRSQAPSTAYSGPPLHQDSGFHRVDGETTPTREKQTDINPTV